MGELKHFFTPFLPYTKNITLRARTHGVKKVPLTHKFESK